MKTKTVFYAWVPVEQAGAITHLQPSHLGLVWVTTGNHPQILPPIGSLSPLVRVAVTDPSTLETWLDVQGEWPMEEWMNLELAKLARPTYWFVSRVPVPVAVG